MFDQSVVARGASGISAEVFEVGFTRFVAHFLRETLLETVVELGNGDAVESVKVY